MVRKSNAFIIALYRQRPGEIGRWLHVEASQTHLGPKLRAFEHLGRALVFFRPRRGGYHDGATSEARKDGGSAVVLRQSGPSFGHHLIRKPWLWPDGA